MPSTVLTTTADLAGRALAAVTGGIAALRPAEKPLHPDGRVWTARLVRRHGRSATGVPWLDRTGTEEVLVRTSRAIGLPGPLPDIAGLAIRSTDGRDGYGDLLLATTGWSPLGRHVLLPAWRHDQPLTTLLPYRTTVGPLLLGARPVDVRGFTLAWCRLGGPWQELGELTLAAPAPDDAEVSFDPVLNQLPGLQQYPWVEHLRERSYATARIRRGDSARAT